MNTCTLSKIEQMKLTVMLGVWDFNPCSEKHQKLTSLLPDKLCSWRVDDGGCSFVTPVTK